MVKIPSFVFFCFSKYMWNKQFEKQKICLIFYNFNLVQDLE